MPEIIVAGGGIGGLAAALAAARGGHRVTVLERRDGFSELGAGIQLAPNAFAALDRLGVGGQVRERGVFVRELRLMDGTTGDRLAAMPLTGRYRSRFGNPYAVVHRSDLYAPLLAACRDAEGVELREGHSVSDYEQHDDRVRVVLSDGSRISGDMLLGADGIRSRVRHRLVGDGDPRVSGHTIYRCLVEMERVPADLRWNCVTLWAGGGWHFVHYPVAGGAHLNMAVTRDDGAAEAVVGVPVSEEFVRGRFPELGGTALRLLELGEQWRSWVLCDRDPVSRWTDGRVALLGDAAHPMLQYAAQGAAMALEDAVVLGGLLDGCATPELPVRLREYNVLRRDRAGRNQLLAREVGRLLYHATGAEAGERNEALSA